MVDDMRDNIAAGLGDLEDEAERCLGHICDDCDPIMDCIPDEYCGRPCLRIEQICEPGEDNCKKVAEHEEICRVLDELHAMRKRIENKKVTLPELPQLSLPFEVVA